MDKLLRILLPLALISVTLALSTRCAEAGNLDATWTAPANNCNNTPLTNLQGYRVRWGSGTAQLPATATSYSITGLLPGTWWINVAAFNSTGAESQYVAGWKTVAPTEFVTKSTTVYTFSAAAATSRWWVRRIVCRWVRCVTPPRASTENIACPWRPSHGTEQNLQPPWQIVVRIASAVS